MVAPVIVAAAGLLLVFVVAFFLLSKKSAAASDGETSPVATGGGEVGPPPKGEAAKEEKKRPLYPLKVYFGSQTGTAEGFATRIVEEAEKHGFGGECIDLEDVEEGGELADTKLAVFLMATYGEGDPTDNAIEFTGWLKDKAGDLEEDALSNTQYCVFGLGNTQYEHYNSMGRLVDKRMAALGATRVYKYGEGDDDNQMEDDFDGWFDDLFAALRRDVLGDTSVDATVGAKDDQAIVAPELRFQAVFLPSAPSSQKEAEMAQQARARGVSASGSQVSVASRHLFLSQPVNTVLNRELRQDTAGGSTVHVEIEAPAGGYETADNLSVCPENEEASVDAVARWLGYDLDQWFALEPRAPSAAKPLFPTPCSVREALTFFCDLQGIPSRRLLGMLAHYATADKERARLHYLSSKEGKGEAQLWLARDKRSLMEVLQAFPSIEIPMGDFVELAPRLQPRLYTIASSALAQPDRVSVTVSVVQEPKPEGRELRGVCSSFLARLRKPTNGGSSKEGGGGGQQHGDAFRPGGLFPTTARVSIQKSTFRLPTDQSVPVVMIGPGSGVAPMVAFCQERAWHQGNGAALGEGWLFFGCRRSDEDYIYRDELEAWAEQGVLSNLVTAFSRETKQKVYVQHRMREYAADIWRMLQEGGHLYICGGTSMGRDCQAEIERIATSNGGMSTKEADAFVTKLKDEKRLVLELWS